MKKQRLIPVSSGWATQNLSKDSSQRRLIGGGLGTINCGESNLIGQNQELVDDLALMKLGALYDLEALVWAEVGNSCISIR